ncbi:thioesterase domain-containing protein, partial [Motilibacter deserti]
EEEGAFDVLLPLRRRGSQAPLFCVHPASGFAWSYAGLMRHLGPDVPVYGLQSRGLAEADELPGSVEEVAADYVAQIRTVQPHGPYSLLGWSFGGLVAHAMATQLQAEGEEVALLAMLDSFPKTAQEAAEQTVLGEQEFLGAMLDLAGYDRSALGDGPLEHSRVAELIRRQGGVLGTVEEHHLAALYAVFANNSRLARRFVPGVFDGEPLLFVATGSVTPDGPGPQAWGPHATGATRAHDIDCVHDAMTTPDALAAICAALVPALGQARDAQPR